MCVCVYIYITIIKTFVNAMFEVSPTYEEISINVYEYMFVCTCY